MASPRRSLVGIQTDGLVMMSGDMSAEQEPGVEKRRIVLRLPAELRSPLFWVAIALAVLAIGLRQWSFISYLSGAAFASAVSKFKQNGEESRCDK